jgi:hypothetical protein
VTRRIRLSSAALGVATSIVALLAACGGSSPPTAPTPPPAPQGPPPTIPAGLSAALTTMLQGLTPYIAQALQANRDLLPNNPQSTSQLQAKITMLQNPALNADIINGRRWVESEVTSSNGRAITFALVFPLEPMRPESGDAVRALEPVLPILESFFDAPFPASSVRVWYGFVLGNSGGGGFIYSEDRSTYEGRTGPNRLPYDAILAHELGHSYISNESLNQFLEVYAYNVIRTGATDPDAWAFKRGWVADLSTNQDLAAVLDVYRLIGHDAMRRAYRAILPLHPSYGQPLSAAVIQTFAAQVPASMQAQVTEKLARVRF